MEEPFKGDKWESQLLKYNPQNGEELIILALNQLMIESGFLLKAPLDNEEDDFLRWSRCSISVLRLNYILREYPSVPVNMTCVTMKPKLLVHGICKAMATMMLSIDLSMYTDNNKSKRLKNSHDLRRIFKDEFSDKIRQGIRSAEDPNSLPPILELPLELIMEILLRCQSAKALLNIGKTCKRFNHIYKDDKLWKDMYRKHFGKEAVQQVNLNVGHVSNWYKQYKTQYEKKLMMEREAREQRRLKYVWIPGRLDPSLDSHAPFGERSPRPHIPILPDNRLLPPPLPLEVQPLFNEYESNLREPYDHLPRSPAFEHQARYSLNRFII